ncbi:MAG TPA: D-alanyl-D-alanine carboxypeptidase/D-alanyl-D-alanine-endopeptidase [Ignavibacteriaceae bacterium]
MADKIVLIAGLFLIASVVLEAQEMKQDTVPKYSFSTIPDFWKDMDDIFSDPNFSSAQWGVVIQSLETGEYFYKRNEDKLFIPASDLKLFTTAAGLYLLGPDYRFSTNVYLNGKIDGSTLAGDLVIEGRGDPTISGRFYNNNMFKVFEDWADSLSAIGIDEITGNIIGYDDDFDDKPLGKGWPWDLESYWFEAPSSPISFNDNVVNINVKTVSNKAVISIIPDVNYIVVNNEIQVVDGDSASSIDIYRERGTNLVNVFGSIHAGDSVQTFVTVNNPTQYSMVVLKDVLRKKGIEVKGYPIDIDASAGPISLNQIRRIFTYYSPPFKEIIKVINKSSENFFAEQLLKTIGFEEKDFGSIENGVEAMQDMLQEMGINPDDMVIADGSGLSRLNLVTPRQMVTLLDFMYKSKYFVPFYNSLPIAGVDGSLGKRMKNTKAVNKIRAKTGYLDEVRSISGYAYTGDSEPVAFSIIANNFLVPYKLVDNLQDLVCIRLASFKRK